MSVLLIAEHNNKELKPFTLNAITAASQIDEDLHVLVIGHNLDEFAKSISQIPNVKKVIQIDNEIYENYLAENFASAVIKNAENYSHIVCSANTFGKNLMPRIAALLDTSQISDIIKVISSDTFLRPIYAGNAFATVKSNDKKKCITIRPTSFDSAPTASAFLTVSCAFSSPTVTATISFAFPDSFIFTASSIALSSGGFVDILTLSVTTPVPSSFTLT